MENRFYGFQIRKIEPSKENLEKVMIPHLINFSAKPSMHFALKLPRVEYKAAMKGLGAVSLHSVVYLDSD